MLPHAPGYQAWNEPGKGNKEFREKAMRVIRLGATPNLVASMFTDYFHHTRSEKKNHRLDLIKATSHRGIRRHHAQFFM